MKNGLQSSHPIQSNPIQSMDGSNSRPTLTRVAPAYKTVWILCY